jgi:four helix bundle protein
VGEKILSHKELRVYQRAFSAAIDIFSLSKSFPKEESYSLTDQIRRSSRSVCANIAEAWRKRRYEAAFIAKLNDVEAEAAETQVWLEFALHMTYISVAAYERLIAEYDSVLRTIAGMINNPESWVIAKGYKGLVSGEQKEV